MLYPYITFPDGTEVLHSQIVYKDDCPTLQVNFERPKNGGFDSARCELPSYNWVSRNGYSDAEIADFTDFLHNNAHLFFKFAASGGVCCA